MQAHSGAAFVRGWATRRARRGDRPGVSSVRRCGCRWRGLWTTCAVRVPGAGVGPPTTPTRSATGRRRTRRREVPRTSRRRASPVSVVALWWLCGGSVVAIPSRSRSVRSSGPP
ncbi:hypothetical protein SNL152K_5977 [Streptomyces sp. NL15-2K]|nr:hypothetical protein SNL152K_5977 [Streptomyces sp. NL15-2K]